MMTAIEQLDATVVVAAEEEAVVGGGEFFMQINCGEMVI